MLRLGSIAETRPRQRDLRGTVATIVGPRFQHRQIGRVLAPGERGVDGRRGIEHAQRGTLGIEELNAVPGLILRADRDREQTALVLPGKLRDVAEGGVAAACELAA